jgi:shikimate kinase
MKTRKSKIIALVGLMGVGKTTIGFKLAQELGYYFIDCDDEIQDRERQTINEIFAKKGEKYFREIEEKIIEEIVSRDENIILSLGGGAFLSEKTRQVLKDNSAITIWLDAPINEIIKRIGRKNNRPLLKNKNKRQVLEELMLKRAPIYALCDLKFTSANINSEALLVQIITKINEFKNA